MIKNVKIFTKEDIQVVNMKNYKINGIGYIGWGLYVEGFGFMTFDGDNLPYMLAGKKYMQAIKDGWGFDWNYGFVQADK